jgi:hypothetical protein
VTSIRISGAKPFVKNTLRGFFDLEFADTGMILRGCAFHEREGKHWIGWPAQSYVKKDGTKSWVNIVDFRDNKTKYLMQDEAIPHVIATFAELGAELGS